MADIQVHVPLPVRCVYGCAVITLPAEIDMANAPAVTDTLLALLGRGASGVVVDMSGTWFCAVAGIRAIVGACDEAQRRGTWIGVVIPHPHVRKIFTLLGADRLVPIYAALDGALARADGHAGRLPERVTEPGKPQHPVQRAGEVRRSGPGEVGMIRATAT